MSMMLPTTSPGASLEPVGDYRWAVWLGGYVDGLIVGWFMECSGLHLERDAEPLAEGGVNDRLHWLPGRIQRGSITLRRGVVDWALWNWFSRYMYDGSVDRHTVLVLLFDQAGNLAWEWTMLDAIPLHWRGPDLKATQEQVAVEELVIGQGDQKGQGSETADGDQAEPVNRAARSKKASQQGWQGSKIDVPRLARKVYGLLQAEVLVEHERLGRRW